MVKRILKSLTNNLGFKLLAFVFAFMLWLVVYNIEDPVITRPYTAIVSVKNEDKIKEMNKCYEIEEEYDISIEEEVGNIDDQVDPIDQGLLSGVNKDGKIVDDSINVAGISNNINPDRERQSCKESTLEFLMNKILEATEEEKIVDDDAEGDDEIVDLVIKGDQDSSGNLDLDYEYDDDELIDLVISGKNLD